MRATELLSARGCWADGLTGRVTTATPPRVGGGNRRRWCRGQCPQGSGTTAVLPAHGVPPPESARPAHRCRVAFESLAPQSTCDHPRHGIGRSLCAAHNRDTLRLMLNVQVPLAPRECSRDDDAAPPRSVLPASSRSASATFDWVQGLTRMHRARPPLLSVARSQASAPTVG